MEILTTDSLSQSSVILIEEVINVIFNWIDNQKDFSLLTDLERNNELGILTTNISSFVEISTLAAKYSGIQLEDLKTSHISLLFIVKAINNAFLKSDWIALEDLIKYELKDNLTQWKINLIPYMKKSK